MDPQRNIFRKTHTHSGRHIAVTPENSSMRELSYARIRLDSSVPAVEFASEESETGLICLSGAARVWVDAQRLDLAQYDAVYIPRDSAIRVETEGHADFAEFSAPVSRRYPLQMVPYAGVQANPALHFCTGGKSSTRTLNIMIGNNVEAGRLLAGYTVSDPGNWTSWPPHEHAVMLEEMYVYTEMPPPGFGVQLVYTNPEDPEIATIVREGDAVLMPRGYHPNVSAPGGRIGFLWAMAAHREVEDRQFGVVNVHPDFAQGGSGLEASGK